jgi:hypothetical protein
VASALLHVGLILLVARAAFAPRPPAADDVPVNATSVRVVVRSPQRRMPEAASVDESQQAELPVAPAVVEIPPASDIAPPEPTPPTAVADGQAAETSTSSNPDGVALDMQGVRASIDSYIAGDKGARLEQQLRECQQYRDRYARWDCPRGDKPQTATRARIDARMEQSFRAWDYGRDLNIARSEKLMTEMLALRPLMEDTGVLGEIAHEAHLLRVGEYERLNPHLRTGNDLVVGTGLNAGPSVGASITVLDIGLGGISVLNGLLNIRWDGKVSGPARTPAPRPNEDDDASP